MSLSDLAKLKSSDLRFKNEVPFGSDNLVLRDILVTKTALLLQTPNLYLPFGLSQQWGHEDRCCLKAAFYANNKSHQVFKCSLERFEDLLLNKLNTVINSTVNNNSGIDHDFSPSIKQGEDLFYPPSLTVKVHPQVKPNIRDVYGEAQKLSYILPGSWATMVICPKHVWINSTTFPPKVGITWYLVEARVRTPIPILQRSLIQISSQDDETLCSICYQKILKTDGFSMVAKSTDNSPLPPLPPDYQKYARMLKLGIPLLAVIQKCQMDYKDPEVLRNHDRNSIADHADLTPLPPPPPPLPKNSAAGFSFSGPPRILFTSDDLKNTLASLGKNKSNHQAPKKTVNLRKHDPRVPSLEMIQERLAKLKKTN